MKYDDFKNLSEEEKEAAFNLMQTDKEEISNLKAELASFKTDNDGYIEENKKLLEEMQKTKEMNYSLARKLNVSGEKQDAETLIHNMFK